MRISDWSSDVCSSDLGEEGQRRRRQQRVLAFGAGGDLDAGVGGGFAEHCGHGGFLSMKRNPNIRPGTVFDNTVFSMLIIRSEEHTSELQSLMRISYAVFCLKKKKLIHIHMSPTL